MQMPAAGHDIRQARAAHESGVEAVAARDLLHRAAEEDHRIGRFEPRKRAQGEFELARAELDLEGAQRQAERSQVLAQELHDRLDLVVALLGEVLVAGAEQLELRLGIERLYVGWSARLARVGGLQ